MVNIHLDPSSFQTGSQPLSQDEDRRRGRQGGFRCFWEIFSVSQESHHVLRLLGGHEEDARQQSVEVEEENKAAAAASTPRQGAALTGTGGTRG